MFFFFLADLGRVSETYASVPSTGAGFDVGWSLFAMIIALAVVCVLAFLVIRFLLPGVYRLRVRKGAISQIRIIERFPLEPRKNLYLIEVGHQKVLVGTSDHQIQALLEISSLTSQSNQLSQQRFEQVLHGTQSSVVEPSRE